MTAKQIRSFWDKVNKMGADECWEWTGSRTPLGYGRIHSNQYAHRVSWELHNGSIPKGLYVLHECDNPPCVNLNHLWLGTQKQNIQDRDKKGRGFFGSEEWKTRRIIEEWDKDRKDRFVLRGVQHPNAKLTEEAVKLIRDLHRDRPDVSYGTLSKEFKISVSHVWNIINDVAWRHI